MNENIRNLTTQGRGRTGFRLVLAGLFAAVAAAVLAPEASALSSEEQLRFADGIYLRGLYDSALSEYIAFVRDFPNDPAMDAALYRIGECYRQKGNRSGADRFYARVTTEFPSSPFVARAALRRAEIAAAAGRYADAAEIATNLLRAHDDGSAPLSSADDLASALYSLATAESKLGHADKAADAYKRVLAEAPSSPYAAYAALDLASLQASDANTKARIAQVDGWFRQAADSATSPSAKAEALFRHASWCYERQQWQDAADIFQQLLVEFPKSPRAPAAHLAAGWAQLRLDDAAAALESADAAIADAADGTAHAAALYLRANAYRALSRFQEDITDYSAVLAANASAPSAPFAAFELMATHFQTKAYEKVLAHIPPNPTADQLPDILWMRAESENALERTDLARGHYDELATSYPASSHAADALMRLAELARAEGRTQEAADIFRRTATDYPSSPSAPAALKASALARFDAGDFEDALADYDAILALSDPVPAPDVLAEARLQRALCLLRAQRLDEAGAALSALLADSSLPAGLRPQALYWSASLALQNNRPADAESAYRACLAAAPSTDMDALARLGLVRALQAQDRADEAADQTTLLLSSPESVAAQPSLIEWLIRHRFDQGRLRDAAEAARVLATHSTDASWRQIACVHLGNAFDALSRPADARTAYAAALQQPAATREAAEARLRLAALDLEDRKSVV